MSPPESDEVITDTPTGLFPPAAADLERMAAEAARDLGKRYRVGDYLGQGAFATVWRAHDNVTGQPLAVKRLGPRVGRADSFHRELRALLLVRSPAVARVVNFLEGGSARYLMLELCTGGSLRSALSRAKRGGPACPPGRTAAVAAGLAEGLGAIHDAGLIHRDIKPENILFDLPARAAAGAAGPWNGVAKLTDFGLAHAARSTEDDEGRPLTGSPPYMAPEQFAGTATPKSDIYALGAVLYELWHRRAPFAGTPEQLARSHAHEGAAVEGHVPAAWAELLGRMLDKNPDARPDAAEVLARLRRPEMDPRSAGQQCRFLGVAPAVLAAGWADGEPRFTAVTREGLFHHRPDGRAAGLDPWPGGRVRAGDDGRLYTLRGRRLLRLAGGRGESVAHLPEPATAYAVGPDGPGQTVFALADGRSWAVSLADGSAEPGPDVLSLGPRPALAALPGGGLAWSDGVDHPRVRWRPAGGGPEGEARLPGPCWRLGWWVGCGEPTLWLQLGPPDGGLSAAYRLRLGGRPERLDAPGPLAAMAQDPAGGLYGLTADGAAVRWGCGGTDAEAVHRWPAKPGMTFTTLAAADGRLAALARDTEGSWLWVTGKTRTASSKTGG